MVTSNAAGRTPGSAAGSPALGASWLLVGLTAAVAVLATIGRQPDPTRLVPILVAAGGLAAIGLGVHRHRPDTALSWVLLAGGRSVALAVAAAEAGGRHAPELVLVHVVALLGHGLTAWGLVELSQRLTRVWDRSRWIDSVVVSLAIGVTATAVRSTAGPPVGWVDQWLVPSVPALDLFLVLLATRSLLAVRRRTASLRLLTLGLLVQLAGDLVRHWVPSGGSGTGPAIWLAATTSLLGAAALHPTVASTGTSVIPWRRLGAVRFAVLVGSLALPMAGLAGLGAAGRADPGVVAFVSSCAIAIGILVLVRVSGLVTYADALADERHRSRFESLAEHSHDAVVIVGPDGSVAWASPTAAVVLGPSADEIAGRPLDALVGAAAARQLAGHLDAVAGQPLGATVDVRATLDPAAERPRQVEGVATNLLDDPAVGGIVLVVRDVTDRVALQRQLEAQAFVDPLTGLANRALFGDRVRHALARRQRDDGGLAVLFVDLDDFKAVNDSLGHGQGDELLVIAGRRIAEALGPGDTAARLGGDEFGVLLEGADEGAALQVADRVLQLLAVPLLLGDLPVTVSASVGVAATGSATVTPADLLRNADLAMYEAKRAGKGRAHVFHHALHERELRQFRFRADLGAALDRGELTVVYQPIVEVGSERLSGAEALLRWHHPVHGPVSPTEFIPLAEATRAIVPIGTWVLRTACEQAAAWAPTLGPLSMDVNVSAVQLTEPGFAAEVAAILTETGVAPELLVLELTESILVHDASAARRVLDELRDLGVRLAIDDFGTGYSSLAYLQNFPIDIVKIDRTFVNRLDHDGRSRALAQSIIAIAGSLGIDTIAEGIETPAQAAAVSALDCLHGQGFHYSRPVGPEAFASLALALDPPMAPAAVALAD